MKRSNIWFASILIASALLLRGVSNGSGATPSNQPHANQVERTTNGQYSNATPVATLSNQPRPSPTCGQSTAYTYNYYNPAPESGLAFFGQIAGIISAIFLAVFTGGLWVTSIWQWRASRTQAEFATHTLTNLERPWISIPNVQGRFIGTDPDGYDIFEIGFEIANTGRSPAMVISTLSATRFTENISALSQEPQYPPAEVGIGRGTIGVSEKVHSDMSVRFRRVDFQKILDGTATLMFFGQVFYKAPWEKPSDIPHETRFCLFYGPPRRFRVPGTEHPGEFHFAGPEAYNRWT